MTRYHFDGNDAIVDDNDQLIFDDISERAAGFLVEYMNLYEDANERLVKEVKNNKVSLINVFNDFYDFLSTLANEADDTLWFSTGTTAHEALCHLATKYDNQIAEELEVRLERDCGGGEMDDEPPARVTCPDCGADIISDGACWYCENKPA